jgi:hypothetical protein
MGGVSHSGPTLYVPCADGVAAVLVSGDRFTVKWTTAAPAPGPVIITEGAVWTVATGSGVLEALNPVTGGRIFSTQIGSVPSRFTSPAAGGGRVVVPAARRVMAFGE